MNSPNLKRAVLLTLLLLPPACARAAEPVTVSVSVRRPGAEVSRSTLGLSYETSLLLPDANGVHYFRPDNKPLVTLFRTLGIKSLRIGGNSVDAPTIPVPGVSDVTALFEFARAAGVKVIYSVRLQEPADSNAAPGAGSRVNAAAAARIAQLIHERHADVLDCFAIGNEPGYYKDYAVYSAKWKAIHDAIIAVYPEAKFCGPDQNPSPDLDQKMVRDFGTAGLVKITQHSYPFGCSYRNPGAGQKDVARLVPFAAAESREKMLAPDAYQVYQGIYEGIAGAIAGTSVSYRLTETNSFWFSGLQGASDSYASALWGLDYLHWWAAHGADGLNFHTGDRTGGATSLPCRYAVFVTSARGYEVRPLGYALKLFDLGGRGRLLSVATAPATPVTAYATLDAGTVFVTLLNKSHGPVARDQPVQIKWDAPCSDSGAQVIFLHARNDDLAAGSAGVALGGAPIQEDGTWSGRWTPLPPAAVSNDTMTVTLPPASVAVVRGTLR